MISAILFINQDGDVIIGRYYRDNVNASAVDAFRLQVIAAKNATIPVMMVDRTSFLYVKQGNMYIAAVTKSNAHPGLVFQFLYNFVEILKAYFPNAVVDENSIRNNFVLIYELLDEIMDFGYPQVLAVDHLMKFIQSSTLKNKKKNKKAPQQSNSQITSQITGAIDWREEGKYKYRKNQVWLDVVEHVNMLRSKQGDILKSDVSGRIMIKTQLSGMPECKLGMNDKLYREKHKEDTYKRSFRKKKRLEKPIAIEDIRFHKAVRLSTFDSDRSVSFIPPDGDFELMSYRVTQNIKNPFQLIAVVDQESKTRIRYNISVKGDFPSKLFAVNVIINIPTPKNTANFTINAGAGKARHDPSKNYIVWRFKRFPGRSSYALRAEVNLLATIGNEQWSRPPITMEFHLPQFAASGMHVDYLKITEKNDYPVTRWVRYITKAGQYQIRI